MGATQYIRQMLTVVKGEIDTNTIIVGDFNTSLSSMERPSRRKVNKETQALYDTLEQMDLTDIYRTFDKSSRIHILLICTWNIVQN